MMAVVFSFGFLLSALSFGAGLALLMRAQPVVALGAAKRPAERMLQVAGDPAKDSALRKQLAQAGFTHPDAVRHLGYAKLGGIGLGFVVGMVLLGWAPQLQQLGPLNKVAVLLSASAFGYYLPVYWVDRRRRAYLRRIELGLPDALDFMLICVEAGQSTDVAIMRVAEDLAPVHPDLARSFLALTEALAAGANRQEAWVRMAQDTDNDDIRQLAQIIVQSTTMGTPVAQTLRVFAADLRDRRVRKVEEKANVLPTKMTLGTMLFTVPPLLILLLAPAVYRISMAY
ncbi:type II secretion system F family protein [Xinfangfangia sp. CPCC 101601]|uniref:Type II secretion system F family protein n=1 Tax=Pseudogemmobacter lacusdianii TaxID=3069608 RepID=A0ABU0VVV3_9RHOB|nr:type II secretion system F family protein [Xinfangfangia sp. CPCC 101601]MDQ2065365.1 type II secretion system F family protein [Xinfangfangia sp. CPCC 101601]